MPSTKSRFLVLVVDQVAVGLSNIIVLALAARSLPLASFGEFALIVMVALAVLGSLRFWVSQGILVHPDEAESRRNDILSAGILGGALGSVLLLAGAGLASALQAHDLALGLAIVSAFVPILAVQDVGRFIAIAEGRPGLAMRFDLVWLVLVLVFLAGAIVADGGLVMFLLSWTVSGSIAGLDAFLVLRRGRVKLTLSWIRDTWSFSWRYGVSALVNQLLFLSLITSIRVHSGAAGVAAVSAAQLLLRPYMAIFTALSSGGMREIAKRQKDGRHPHRAAVILSLLLAATAGVNAVLVFVLPDSLGHFLIKEAWDAAKPVQLPLSLNIVMAGFMAGPRIALLGLRAVRLTFRLEIILMPIVSILPITGALYGGVEWACWGVLVAQVILTCVWATAYVLRTRAPLDPLDTPDAERVAEPPR